MPTETIAGVRRDRLTAFAAREAARYASARPKAAAAMKAGAGTFLSGVPMHWMADWPMPHLPLVASAKGAKIEDIDGNTLDDFCLGDTGSMFGHSPPPVAKAIRAQARHGLTYMLPTKAALEAGRLLADRHHRHRCQPLCPAGGPRHHRAAEGAGLQRLLSWHGG
jgi:glutamate-1-semialdehyde 2,1-aminomutase